VKSADHELEQLERELQDGVLTHNKNAIERLVADEFVLWASGRLGVLNRTTWIQAALAIEWQSFEFLEFNVLEYVTAAVVNSRMSQAGALEGQDISGQFLVTDVWVQQNGSWRLVTRHASRVS
jgi:hypothetical protein